jgi:hypothetical protein
MHYNLNHYFTCIECNIHLPSNKLLDLHISENHDFYFQVLSEKKEMFQCFIEGCNLKFKTKKERKIHLTTIHQINESFLKNYHLE